MAVTHGTTTGGNNLSRIYDRLRKRSDRAVWEKPRATVIGHISYTGFTHGDWSMKEHEAFVAGVRQALSAVEAG